MVISHSDTFASVIFKAPVISWSPKPFHIPSIMQCQLLNTKTGFNDVWWKNRVIVFQDNVFESAIFHFLFQHISQIAKKEKKNAKNKQERLWGYGAWADCINALRPRQYGCHFLEITIFWNGFSWLKIYKFRLKINLSLFLGTQLTILQHWFR